VESPFEVLGITPDADDGEIVDAYRERVKEAHPDQGGSAAEFQTVKTAYERLQNGYEPGDPLPEETAEPEAEEAPSEPDDPMVEFLNFEVLEDHGWALEDEDLFAKAADANLQSTDFGRFYVDPNDTLLEAAEKTALRGPLPAAAARVRTVRWRSSTARCRRRRATSSRPNSPRRGFACRVSPHRCLTTRKSSTT